MLIKLASSRRIHASDRLSAAKEVAHRDRGHGQNLLWRLAEDNTVNASYRIDAAECLADYNPALSALLLRDLKPPKKDLAPPKK